MKNLVPQSYETHFKGSVATAQSIAITAESYIGWYYPKKILSICTRTVKVVHFSVIYNSNLYVY